MTCRKSTEYLADMLFEPQSVAQSVKTHIAACGDCTAELASMRATMNVLDEWKTPELSPFFDAKLSARVRAEMNAKPAGFFEKLRARLLFNSNLQLRPVAVTALTVAIAVGGAGYAGYFGFEHPGDDATVSAPQSATVRDLQSLDKNDQVFQQLDSVDQLDDDAGSSSN
jgi:hypothetical protein